MDRLLCPVHVWMHRYGYPHFKPLRLSKDAFAPASTTLCVVKTAMAEV